MGALSAWHLLILALVALLVFGGSGRISSIMGDMAKGIKSFKKGLSEDGQDNKPELEVIDRPTPRITERQSETGKTS